jgi:hypothetical protein
VGDSGKVVPILLSIHNLDLHIFLKMRKVDNFNAILCKENELNLVTRLWCKIFTFTILNHKLLAYIKLAEIYPIQVFGFDEDE